MEGSFVQQGSVKTQKMGEAGKRHYGWDHQHNEKYHWCGPGGVGGGGNQVRQLNIKNLVKNISYPRILKGPLFFCENMSNIHVARQKNDKI